MHHNIGYVYLCTTNYCNLHCTFCNRDEVVANSKLVHMPVGDVIRICEKLKNEPITDVKLQGLGEPFMHPQFDKVCSLFKSYFPDSYVITATNAQIKFSDKYPKVLENISLLYLSIDGYKENYEKFRPPSKWNKLITFLDEFKTTTNLSKVYVQYTVNKETIYDIEKVYNEIVLEYELGGIRLNLAQCWSEGNKAKEEYTQEEIDYLKINWSQYFAGKKNWEYDKCWWPSQGMYIDSNGDIIICPLNTDIVPIGNILKQDLDTIKKHSFYNKLQTSLSLNKPILHCKTCSYYTLKKYNDQLLGNQTITKHYETSG